MIDDNVINSIKESRKELQSNKNNLEDCLCKVKSISGNLNAILEKSIRDFYSDEKFKDNLDTKLEACAQRIFGEEFLLEKYTARQIISSFTSISISHVEIINKLTDDSYIRILLNLYIRESDKPLKELFNAVKINQLLTEFKEITNNKITLDFFNKIIYTKLNNDKIEIEKFNKLLYLITMPYIFELSKITKDLILECDITEKLVDKCINNGFSDDKINYKICEVLQNNNFEFRYYYDRIIEEMETLLYEVKDKTYNIKDYYKILEEHCGNKLFSPKAKLCIEYIYRDK